MHISYPPNYLKHHVALLRLNLLIKKKKNSAENAFSATMPQFNFQAFNGDVRT